MIIHMNCMEKDIIVGKKISEISYNKETQGENLRTTIDLEIQQLAQELLKNQAGSICVMDIYLSLIHI